MRGCVERLADIIASKICLNRRTSVPCSVAKNKKLYSTGCKPAATQGRCILQSRRRVINLADAAIGEQRPQKLVAKL